MDKILKDALADVNVDRIIFCNIAWMKEYKGYKDSDKAIGGGSYYDDWKHEQFNFLNMDGKYYGYVQPPISAHKIESINLKRIEPSCNPEDEELDDVLIIWTATSPEPDYKGTYIVGWYKHAKVYKYSQPRIGYDHYSYYFSADVDNCVLLEEKERLNPKWKIPRGGEYGEGWMGRSNVWYANIDYNKLDQETIDRIVELVSKRVRTIYLYV